jgi:EAL domain-containing protein (putative c-di-GMP-specific phosphodiesterase class I)
LRGWQESVPDAGSPVVSVNLSALQLRQRGLVDYVAACLKRNALDPARLQLEITESSVMEDPASAARTLRELKGLGVRLAIDDFGTGYSSLAYLRSFPLDVLKIDRSFVSDMDRDSQSAEIVSAVITLAHALELEVIAEGVETAEQLDRLRRLGCDIGQGYYFAKPLPEPEAGRLLRELKAGTRYW